MTVSRESLARLKNYASVEFGVDTTFVPAAFHFMAAAAVLDTVESRQTREIFHRTLNELMTYGMEKSGLDSKRADAFLAFMQKQFDDAVDTIAQELINEQANQSPRA